MRDLRPRELFQRYRDRDDTRALGELFDRVAPELSRVAGHLARDAAEAEDLVQAAFLTLLEHPDRPDPRRSLVAWMVGVMGKEAKAWGRAAARRPEAETVLAEPVAREERERPAARAMNAESRSLVTAALERLPERYRDVLERHLLRHETPAEIARTRNASAAVVRVELHRGLARLRPLLPGGLAGGLVLSLPGRGHAAMRGELLDHASRAVPAGALAAGATIVGSGGLLALQRIGLGVLALGLVAVTARLAGVFGDEPRSGISPSAAEATRVAEGASPIEEDEPAATTREASAPPPATREALIDRLLVETLFADGTPAPHTGFLLQPFRSGSTREPVRHRTGEDGTVVLEGLEPGEYALYGDRGGNSGATVQQMRFAVEDGTDPDPELLRSLTPRATLRLPVGRDAGGRVVDRDGRPVAGATIWISTGITRSYGLEAARTDAEGRFELRQLQPECFLGARHDDHAPSRPQHVQYWSERTPEDRPLELELVLGARSAALAGRVLGPDGLPLGGATLRVGAQTNHDRLGPTGAEGPPPPVEVRTARDGSFEARGLAPGEVGVSCRYPGLPVRAAALEIGAGERGQLELSLVEGAWIRGHVVDPGGEAMAGATVSAVETALRFPNPPAAFLPHFAQTDADGSFELGPLAPGFVRLTARGPSFLGSTRLPETRAGTELEVLAGERREWTARLEGLPVARGRALDERGEPLAGWSVVSSAEEAPGPPPRAVSTDGEGRFALPVLGEGSVLLALFPPSHSEHPERRWSETSAPWAWVGGVRGGDGDIVLRLSPENAPTARLVLWLEAPGAAPDARVVVSAVHETFGIVKRFEHPLALSVLEIDELPAGKLWLRLEGAGVACRPPDPFELSANATVDVGVLRLQEPTR